MGTFANLVQFDVFISSANEVSQERTIACEVIEELNRGSHAREHHYRLHSLIYERDAVSGMGAPQSVIDRTMGRAEDAEIFVCILWRRLGRGTKEELERAREAHASRRRPQLIFLHSKRGLQQEQVSDEMSALLRELESSALLTAYSNDDEFRASLRSNLDRTIGEFLIPTLRAARPETLESRMLDLMSEVWLSSRSEGAGTVEFPLYASDLALREMGTIALSPDELHSIYTSKAQKLVILGEKGSGKSYALLMLLERLIFDARAAVFREKPAVLPIVLNAASWMEKQSRSFEDWFADELRIFYNLPGSSVKTLVEMLALGQLVILIDGLDEIEPERTGADRTAPEGHWVQAFVKVLNEALLSSSVSWLVVVSRTTQYLALQQPLELPCAPLRIEPLNQPTIEQFLDRPQLSALRSAVRELPELASLTTSPFLLQIMGIAYANAAPEIFRTMRGGKTQDLLFQQYIAKQFSHSQRPPKSRFRLGPFSAGLADSQRWLGWLASKLKTQEAPGTRGAMLLVERIPPSWLERSDRTFSSYAVAAATLLALFVAVTTGVPCALAIGFEFAAWRGSVWGGIMRGLQAGSITGVVGGMLLVPGFCLARGWTIAISIGLALGAARGILIGMSMSDNGTAVVGFERGLSDGLMTMAIALPGAASIMYMRSYRRDDIVPIEVVADKSAREWRLGWVGLPVGLGVALVFGLLRDWGRGVGFGLALGLLVGCVRVFKGARLPAHVRPNQGINQSLRHSLHMGTLMAVVGVIAFGTSYGTAQDLGRLQGRIAAVVNGTLGLVLFIVSLFFGALPVIQHYGLRIAMWRRGVTPLRLVAFLEFAVRLRLLQRVGGSYIFIHESLRAFCERSAQVRPR